MSILRKKPFIEELLGELSVAEIERLTTVINQKGTPETVSLPLNLPNAIPFSAPELVDDKIKLVNLFIGSNSGYTGILVYHSTSYCAFIGTVPFENDIIKLFKLDVTNRKAEPINEKLTADELRRVIDDTVEATQGEVTQADLADKVKFIEVSNITALTDAQIDGLKVGDVVQKITGSMKHCYTVTYKQEHHGICLSYFDCGYLETISYDYTEGHWVFNSKDVCEVQGNIKLGTYILSGETLKWVEEFPSDYSGTAYSFGDDGLYIENYADGSFENSIFIASGSAEVSSADGSYAYYNVDGANKLNFAELTHSLAELDSTLRQLVEDAIDDSSQGVACTQAQWDVIKALLDKSLYFNYENVSMIKTFTNGINMYTFGGLSYTGESVYTEYTLGFYYDSGNENLSCKFIEI